jgi:hypothetical protein
LIWNDLIEGEEVELKEECDKPISVDNIVIKYRLKRTGKIYIEAKDDQTVMELTKN